MNISAKTKFCIIIGNPVDHSLSPLMHNAAYKELGIDHKFVFLGTNTEVKDVKKITDAMRVMKNFRGLTCTIPHKIEIVKYLDEIDEVAKKIGAVNTVVNSNGILKGYNTDWVGAITPIEKITSLKNKRIAIIGAGGAARAIGYGVLFKDAKLTIFNRTGEKAFQLGNDLGCPSQKLYEVKDLRDFDIIINATSVGMKPQENIFPFPENFIQKNHIVFDIVYSPYETLLLKTAKKIGAKIIHGLDMLLHQGSAQFELYTNQKAPIKVMEQALLYSFQINNT